jgi:dihydrolipoamide dehydrogenase
MVKGVHFLMKKNKITELDGWGTFQDARSIVVTDDAGEQQTVTFGSCIIATGSTTKMLPGVQRSERVVTYEEQILADSLPASIIICSAGAISTGSPCCAAASRSPSSNTSPHGPLEDRRSRPRSPRLKLGVKVTGHGVKTIAERRQGDGHRRSRQGGADVDSKTQGHALDRLCRAPRLRAREHRRGPHRARGHQIDDFMRVGARQYAIGDVTAKLMLAHTAGLRGGGRRPSPAWRPCLSTTT